VTSSARCAGVDGRVSGSRHATDLARAPSPDPATPTRCRRDGHVAVRVRNQHRLALVPARLASSAPVRGHHVRVVARMGAVAYQTRVIGYLAAGKAGARRGAGPARRSRVAATRRAQLTAGPGRCCACVPLTPCQGTAGQLVDFSGKRRRVVRTQASRSASPNAPGQAQAGEPDPPRRGYVRRLASALEQGRYQVRDRTVPGHWCCRTARQCARGVSPRRARSSCPVSESIRSRNTMAR